MAEIINESGSRVVNEATKIPSNAKTNAALALGIIGTALGGLTALGGIGTAAGMFANGHSSGRSVNGGVILPEQASIAGYQVVDPVEKELQYNEHFLERKIYADELYNQKEVYEWKLQHVKDLTDAFFDSYKRDVDNSFGLYKYNRDSNDVINQRINELDKKVDIMAAVRPYQDALIDNKINTNALLADFNLERRTARMIEGQIVLPNDPTVTGFGSQSTPFMPIPPKP